MKKFSAESVMPRFQRCALSEDFAELPIKGTFDRGNRGQNFAFACPLECSSTSGDKDDKKSKENKDKGQHAPQPPLRRAKRFTRHRAPNILLLWRP